MFICSLNAEVFTSGVFSLTFGELFKRPPSSASKGRPDFHLLTGLLKHFISSRCSDLYISYHVTSFFFCKCCFIEQASSFQPLGEGQKQPEINVNTSMAVTLFSFPHTLLPTHPSPLQKKIAFKKCRLVPTFNCRWRYLQKSPVQSGLAAAGACLLKRGQACAAVRGKSGQN